MPKVVGPTLEGRTSSRRIENGCEMVCCFKIEAMGPMSEGKISSINVKIGHERVDDLL